MPHVVVNNITPRVSYSPTTGTSYTIPSTWGFFASSDITVYSGTTALSYAASPTSSTQFATSGSAVDGGFQGGNIVLGAASTANTITLVLEVPVERATDFPYPAGSISIEDLNTDIDKAYVLMQQFNRDIARVPAMADSDTGTLGTLPSTTARASKFLSFDSTGGITVQTLSLSGTTATIAAFMTTFLNSSNSATALTNIGAASDPTTTAGDMIYRDSTGLTRLAIGAAGTIPSSTNGIPAWKTLTTLLDELFSSTQGAVLYRGATGWASLAAGTSGNVLTTNGSGGNPSWNAVSSVSAADQAAMEAATSTTQYVSPGRQHYHPGHAKAWATITWSGTTAQLATDYGVASIADNGVGDVTVTFDTTFSSSTYGIVVGLRREAAGTDGGHCVIDKDNAPTTGATRFNVTGVDGTSLVDPTAFYCAFFGDQ